MVLCWLDETASLWGSPPRATPAQENDEDVVNKDVEVEEDVVVALPSKRPALVKTSLGMLPESVCLISKSRSSASKRMQRKGG